MDSFRRRLRPLFFAVASSFLIAASAHAQSADYYRGKTIRIVVANPAGGSHDLYARMIARYLGKYVPGEPNVIVENMPGAGGLRVANYFDSIVRNESTVLGAMNSGFAFEPLFGASEAKFDPTKFHWVGTPASPTAMLTVWHAVPVYSLEDARNREVILGGGGGTTAIYTSLLNALFGLKLKLIPGYSGQNAAYLAMERGEVDGYPNSFWSTIKSSYPSWITERKVRFLVQFGAANPEIPADVPTARSMVKTAEDRQLLDLGTAPLELGFPYIMPPDAPGEHVAIIRKGLASTFANPQFKAEANKAGFDVDDKPQTGEEMTAVLVNAYNAPVSVRERFVAIYKSGRQ